MTLVTAQSENLYFFWYFYTEVPWWRSWWLMRLGHTKLSHLKHTLNFTVIWYNVSTLLSVMKQTMFDCSVLITSTCNFLACKWRDLLLWQLTVQLWRMWGLRLIFLLTDVVLQFWSWDWASPADSQHRSNPNMYNYEGTIWHQHPLGNPKNTGKNISSFLKRGFFLFEQQLLFVF